MPADRSPRGMAASSSETETASGSRIVKQNAKTVSEKKISTDTTISSDRKGFEYLNELFIKRHRKILWNSAEKIASVCAFLVCGTMLFLYAV